MSWVCVAPAGDDYFEVEVEVEVVRGPTVVEFAVGTPRPMGHASITTPVESPESSLATARRLDPA
jgi:hypothetical protein